MTNEQSTEPLEAMGIVPPSPADDARLTAPIADAAELPRVRWAGIFWGALLGVLALVAFVFVVDPARRADVRAWLIELDPSTVNPGSVAGWVVLAVGVAVLLAGGAAIARRASQRG